MKQLLLLLSIGLSAVAQDVPSVSVSPGPPPIPYQVVYNYSGSNVSSICYAPSTVANSGRYVRQVVTITSISKANPAVVTVSGGHGINLSSLPSVTISGATGTGWTAANATFTATPTGTTTFTIPIDTTSFGTLGGTVIFHSSAPLLNQASWAVELYAYNTSNQPISITWLAGSSALAAKCSDAGSSTINNQ